MSEVFADTNFWVALTNPNDRWHSAARAAARELAPRGLVTTEGTGLAAIKSFMRYMEFRLPTILEQSRSIRAIPEKRADRRLITHLSLEEMQALLNARDLKTRDGIRDRAMLHLGFACGLRVSELVTLPVTAVSFASTPRYESLARGVESDYYLFGERRQPIFEIGYRSGATWQQQSYS